MWKWAAGLVGGVALALAAWGLWYMYGAFLLPGGLTGQCGSDVLERRTSPDSRIDAYVVRVNCGATAAYTVEVILTPAGRSVDDKGAVTVARFKWNEAATAWEGGDLVVVIDDRAKAALKLAEGMGAPVRYRTVHATEADGEPAREAWIREQEAKQGAALN